MTPAHSPGPVPAAARPPWRGVLREFREILPPVPDESVVTLLEGNTPLVPIQRLAARISPRLELYVKIEGQNPTGSFKDRGMTVAVSRAVAAGARAVLCASTGNTSASAAAYAARCGLRCVVVIPSGQIALGKLAQAMMYGARVVAVEGNFDKALELVRALSQEKSVSVVNSINPDRIEGQKTIAYEIVDALGGRVPDAHALPVGNAGNITAAWKGYVERARREGDPKPRMLGFQAEGAAPIVRGHRVPEPKTLATAIKIGNPASWEGAKSARDESGGLIEMVTDDEIVAAYKLLAEMEGIFVEPASAAGIAGLLKLGAEGRLRDTRLVVATVTGHGLKDPERAVAVSPPVETVRADAGTLRRLLLE
ncbi:MAG TPA: threonine synthase [Candidatus Limnocylindrales bacterium]|nr:threonine synthase [Candidatus Limnocylindrales bacterium]